MAKASAFSPHSLDNLPKQHNASTTWTIPAYYCRNSQFSPDLLRNGHEITATSSLLSLRQRPALCCVEEAVSTQVAALSPLREKAGIRRDLTGWFYSPLPQPYPAGEGPWRPCNPLFFTVRIPIGQGWEETMSGLFRERSQAKSALYNFTSYYAEILNSTQHGVLSVSRINVPPLLSRWGGAVINTETPLKSLYDFAKPLLIPVIRPSPNPKSNEWC